MSLDARKAKLLMELRSGGVGDKRVLGAIEKTPREKFVPPAFRAKAHDNVALPIGFDQTISQPLVVGLMTQALELTDRMKVLEIGTGSGYQTAVLARLARRVYTVERHAELLKEAEKRLAALRITNVTAKMGDGSRGWPEQAPFQRILVTAAAADIPPLLVDQLAVGGIMIVPIGSDDPMQHLVRVRRTERGSETEDLGPVKFVPLVGEPVPH
ncbi:MAG: protein-L-isoaspartate(D-aspartate) O-methyltransferase [Rhodospirillales bacterium]|nr:protein-L-isoaspartate(D-aspartate) O-methyltransferase [Rhodospirillales bacterium]MSP81135.1 protein-L-isoaspartate(D-aspartate) O-methyltransferase [Rhodospirillales bacterium]